MVAVYGLKNRRTRRFDYIGSAVNLACRLRQHFNGYQSQFFKKQNLYAIKILAMVAPSDRWRVENAFIRKFSAKKQVQHNGQNRSAIVYGVLNQRTAKFDFIGATVDLPKHGKYQLHIWRTVYHRPVEQYTIVPLASLPRNEAETLAISLVSKFARHGECQFNRVVKRCAGAFRL